MKLRGFAIVRDWLDKDIHLPQRQTGASAGYDLEAAEDCRLPAGGMVLVPTGLKAYMQPGEVLTLHIRSSMAVKHQLMLANSVGIIDADYYDNPQNEGHIMVALVNLGKEDFLLHKGERVAQGIFLPYLTADADEAGRGSQRQGGFGSTGKGE
ncbi:MAG: dUTP diphosphatase [Selenomonas sp.]|uniref:dUTP diphosphatase n=1 Tax=Selenomonas sp. TaxID=2053611 RepID=UPI0025E1043C|nr:dUTP diphosphatase [Selenomonas sp.]MCR5757154.1 dUTP diphosphatase [Selenomonas sp.]